MNTFISTHSNRYFDMVMLPLLLMSSVALATHAQAQDKIYKSVDENGNVTYSDQPPTPDAKPMLLQESNIIETVKAQPAPVNAAADEAATQPLQIGILSPQPEETFWGTGNDLPVLLEVKPDMRPGMQVNLYIDDAKIATVASEQTTLQQIDRGTHTFRAELVGINDEIIATSETRTFFMKQYSQNFNNN